VVVAGLGWQALWALPALLLQPVAVGLLEITPTRFSGVRDFLLFLYVPWPVHVAGVSVRVFFEETVQQLTGQRQSTLADNIPYFAVLMLIQAVVLSILFLRRYRAALTLRDLGIAGIAVFVAINSLSNIRWSWWGT
jgi:hypothetical protein